MEAGKGYKSAAKSVWRNPSAHTTHLPEPHTQSTTTSILKTKKTDKMSIPAAFLLAFVMVLQAATISAAPTEMKPKICRRDGSMATKGC
ncbi:hypothetical protein PtA15_15A387 [Puccinia triticina]|uniref:Uncharacterized protein n=1 Tax=Puccinia triticina TaxID=208348 RepID=A0ABY7D2Z3_9BASI|nr:uncharacterized protein PtA15_15A387 [Puccinia triticina]WAQ91994.1 hypothetical protein PtA15_15A387 [Puccinia triticina]WAR62800.1 hypothetical protein PtB15_15B388 [Puccinia triticina]